MTAPRCRNPLCGKPRTERKDSPGNYAGVDGLCSACTSRWYRAGKEGDGPPPPMSHADRTSLANAARKATVAARAAQYARLRGIGCSPAQAALRLGMGEWARLRAEWAYGEIAAREEAA